MSFPFLASAFKIFLHLRINVHLHNVNNVARDRRSCRGISGNRCLHKKLTWRPCDFTLDFIHAAYRSVYRWNSLLRTSIHSQRKYLPKAQRREHEESKSRATTLSWGFRIFLRRFILLFFSSLTAKELRRGTGFSGRKAKRTESTETNLSLAEAGVRTRVRIHENRRKDVVRENMI